MALQDSVKLLTDPRWPEAITVLAGEGWHERLIQHPCPGLYQRCVKPMECAQLLHRLDPRCPTLVSQGPEEQASSNETYQAPQDEVAGETADLAGGSPLAEGCNADWPCGQTGNPILESLAMAGRLARMF